MTYIKNDIIFTDIKTPQNINQQLTELQHIKIHLTKHKALNIHNVYIPPRDTTNPDHNNADMDITNCMTYILDSDRTIVTGYFNAHHHMWYSVPPRLGPYMIEPTRLSPHDCAHTRLCPHTIVPTHVCAHTRLCPDTIVPRHVCAQTRLCPDTFVPTHVCAHTRLCPHTIVPTHVCAQTRLCPHTIVPTHVCAHTHLCPHTFVPRHICALMLRLF